MEPDESIVELSEKLDAWCDGFFGLLESKDSDEQRKALVRGIEIAKELDRYKVKGLAALAALLARQGAMAENERITSLTEGFVFGVKLADALHDELLDIDGETKALKLVKAIVENLEAIGSGRTALAALLDHPEAGVRVGAGVFLLDSMPDRVVPILRKVADIGSADIPSFRAYWALCRWKHDGKIRDE
jgi:hypothetical protein